MTTSRCARPGPVAGIAGDFAALLDGRLKLGNDMSADGGIAAALGIARVLFIRFALRIVADACLERRTTPELTTAWLV